MSKIFTFRVMARVYEDVEVEAEDMDDARDKFMADHGEVIEFDNMEVDGFPQAFCLNPDKMDECGMYDVAVTTQARGNLKVSAKSAPEAVEKAKAFHELIGFSKGFYGEFMDDLVSVAAVNEDDETDEHEISLEEQ